MIGLSLCSLVATGIAGAKEVNGCLIAAATECPDADLTGLSMEDESLAQADLHGAILTNAWITRSDLTRINLSEATLTLANITNTKMAGAILTGAKGDRLYLGYLGMRRASANGSAFIDAKFKEVNGARADFTGSTLTRLNLQGGAWTDADFTRADLSGANISYAQMRGVILAQAYFRAAILQGIDANNADLRDATFYATSIRPYDGASNYSSSTFVGADLTVATIVDASVTSTDFTRSTLSGLGITDSFLSGNTFALAQGNIFVSNSDLTGRQTSGTYLPNFFTEAQLSDSRFIDSDLRGVNFGEADLRGTDFSGSNLRGTDFDGADMRRVTLPDSQLGGRPSFGCDRATKWSGAYAERFSSYCRTKGKKVVPAWCQTVESWTPALCLACNKICVFDRSAMTADTAERTPCPAFVELVEADKDYSDLGAAFREQRDLPAKGPIASAEGLDLYTEVVSPGVF